MFKPKDTRTLSKADKYRKFSRLKDLMHKNFGKTTITLDGKNALPKQPLICNFCKERVYTLTSIRIGDKYIEYCDRCSTAFHDYVNKLKDEKKK